MPTVPIPSYQTIMLPLLQIAGDGKEHAHKEVTPLLATITNAYGVVNEEYGLPIYVCRGPRRPLAEVWPQLQTMD